ncbi:DNA-binding protein [Methylobacterium sp. P1-11]|nr:DNA-binding protein [Methylobacterium sp. P1-11]
MHNDRNCRCDSCDTSRPYPPDRGKCRNCRKSHLQVRSFCALIRQRGSMSRYCDVPCFKAAANPLQGKASLTSKAGGYVRFRSIKIPNRERVTIAEAAAILGVSLRVVQRLASKRQLPTAAKVGRLWTFNEAAIRAWLVEQESKPPCQQIERRPRRAATGEVAHSGRALPSPGRSTGSASRQVIQSLRAAARPRSTHG